MNNRKSARWHPSGKTLTPITHNFAGMLLSDHGTNQSLKRNTHDKKERKEKKQLRNLSCEMIASLMRFREIRSGANIFVCVCVCVCVCR
jgi:hypothetical protein